MSERTFNLKISKQGVGMIHEILTSIPFHSDCAEEVVSWKKQIKAADKFFGNGVDRNPPTRKATPQKTKTN